MQSQDPPGFRDIERQPPEGADAADERAWGEALVSLTEGLPGVDATRGAERLARAVAELPLRYAPFFGRLSQLWRLAEGDVVSELSRAREPAAWSRSVLRGLQTFDVSLAEPSHGRARLLRFAPGARFPQHRHRGDERVLVLEGAFADDTGREVWAGQEATQEAGSSHELVILGDVPCVTAVMEQGLEFTRGWLRLVNRFVR